MAYINLGSKSGAFHRQGQTWSCTTGLPSDVRVEIGEMSFHLHKFPLISRSGLLEKLIEEFSSEDGSSCILQLHEIPGGAKAFELVTKFCYGVKIELTALNVVSLRCAADYLLMNEEHGEGNLISKTEGFLNEVFSNWTQSIKALETCEEVLPYAEELHIVTRCIDSLAIKACSDTNLFNWPCNEPQSPPADNPMWNGIYSVPKPRPVGDDWWHDDVSLLSLPLFKRFVLAVELKGMKPESIAASLVYYAKRYIPLMNRLSSFKDKSNINMDTTVSTPSEPDQRILLEEIVELLPNKKGVTSTKTLLRLLRTAMTLHASTLCRENLERRAGARLDHATLEDLLIPNVGYSVETLYDIDCVQRILNHFVSVDQAATASFSPSIVEEGKFTSGPDSLTPMTLVANLVDGYLAEMAPDVNLKLPKFQTLAAVIPDYARPTSDGMYHAIDVYLKIQKGSNSAD